MFKDDYFMFTAFFEQLQRERRVVHFVVTMSTN